MKQRSEIVRLFVGMMIGSLIVGVAGVVDWKISAFSIVIEACLLAVLLVASLRNTFR